MSTLAAPRTAAARAFTIRWDRVAVVVALALLLLWGLATAAQGSRPPAGAADQPAVVVVQPGDTLWALARDHAPPGVATLEYVAAIEAANGVRAGALVPGTPLRLPAP
jgi:hypothetical protein